MHGGAFVGGELDMPEAHVVSLPEIERSLDFLAAGLLTVGSETARGGLVGG